MTALAFVVGGALLVRAALAVHRRMERARLTLAGFTQRARR